MKGIKYILVLVVLIILSCGSNDDNKDFFLPKITGKTGEVLVIMEDNQWNSSMGRILRTILMQDHPSLPQAEPLFNVMQIKHKAFSKIFVNHRNIIRTRVAGDIEKATIKVINDKWATPQLVLDIEAPDEASFKKIVEDNRDRIENYIMDAEMERIIDYHKKYAEPEIGTKIKQKFNVNIHIPRGYSVYREEENFIWLHHETKKLHQGVWLYSIPYTDTALLNAHNLVTIRDNIGKKYIQGETENSYMSTEHRLPINYEAFLDKEQYTVKMSGLWRMVNDFMGGPFVSYTKVDEKNNRLIIAEGFVYAGKQEKRNFLWQVEGIVKSMTLQE